MDIKGEWMLSSLDYSKNIIEEDGYMCNDVDRKWRYYWVYSVTSVQFCDICQI